MAEGRKLKFAKSSLGLSAASLPGKRRYAWGALECRLARVITVRDVRHRVFSRIQGMEPCSFMFTGGS